MKATMEVGMDTVWANKIVLSLECEFDNPHRITVPRLAELMVQRMKVMVEEVRHADERGLPDLEPTLYSGVHDAQAERERLASDELQRNKAQGSIFAERREGETVRG